MTRLAFILTVFLLPSSMALSQDTSTEIFSGPQVGEPLPGFTMKVALGGKVGTDTDFVTEAGDAPVAIVFVHQLTRPGFALANAVMKYCLDAGSDKVRRGICFLSQDPTQAQTQIDRAKRYFPKETLVGYSTEGIEGPGAYGLNRNVQVTVLVAKEGKVVANFALVQPGVHADGPKILNAIAAAIGASKAPDINNYIPNNQAAQDAPIAIDPSLMAAVRQLNRPEADEEMVAESIKTIEQLIKGKKSLEQQLGGIVGRWVRSGRIREIGTKDQQAAISQWARQPRAQGRRMNARKQDEKLTGLLRNLIQKTNSDEQVDQAAKEIEAYINTNEFAKSELKRISTTVVNGGKLENYGTESCQEKLKAWVKQFQEEK